MSGKPIVLYNTADIIIGGHNIAIYIVLCIHANIHMICTAICCPLFTNHWCCYIFSDHFRSTICSLPIRIWYGHSSQLSCGTMEKKCKHSQSCKYTRSESYYTQLTTFQLENVDDKYACNDPCNTTGYCCMNRRKGSVISVSHAKNKERS